MDFSEGETPLNVDIARLLIPAFPPGYVPGRSEVATGNMRLERLKVPPSTAAFAKQTGLLQGRLQRPRHAIHLRSLPFKKNLPSHLMVLGGKLGQTLLLIAKSGALPRTQIELPCALKNVRLHNYAEFLCSFKIDLKNISVSEGKSQEAHYSQRCIVKRIIRNINYVNGLLEYSM